MGHMELKHATFVNVSMNGKALRDYLQQATVNEGREHKCQVVVHQIRPKGDKSKDIPYTHLFLTLIPFH